VRLEILGMMALLVQPEQWEYLAQPAPPELLGLTVLQAPLELSVSPEQQG
jgi:hypothetical protein